jgi:heme/copper-type cytochrome/quinol oxidase subunit 3
VSDDQTFRAIWLVSLLLMVVAAAVPLARSQRQGLRQAAVWVLAFGFLFAGYRIVEWLMSR